ncbi:MAG: hypothetical protein NT170_03505 [Candidatus Moranbacteria bacterium]|nr:hypothetical protein [Candidatus Moranbacteria bacterium]
MDKALRNAIIAGIIIIAISFGYYLVVFLPKKEAMRLEQQGQVSSDNLGRTLQDTSQSQISDSSVDTAESHQQKKDMELEYAKESFKKKEDVLDKEALIASLAKSGWELKSDGVTYGSMSNQALPYYANETIVLEDPQEQTSRVEHEQLFIYDSEKNDWVPVGVNKREWENGEFIFKDNETMWTRGNDWKELFIKDYAPQNWRLKK